MSQTASIIKYIIIQLLAIYCNCCFAQEIKFQAFLTKACTTTEKLDTSYFLTSLSRNDTIYPKNGIAYLPSIGKYRISFYPGPALDSTVIEIKDTNPFIFKYKEPMVQLYVTGGIHPSVVYTKCDSLLNGYAETFHSNGKLKMRGNFFDGRAKDSIITFYPNGQIERHVSKTKKIVIIKEYDQLGNLITLCYNQRTPFMTYFEYKRTEFFTNGKIKSKQSSIRRIETIEEFYPTGQLKTKQTKNRRDEYFENGTKRIAFKWTSKRDEFNKKAKDLTVYKNEYDQNGQLIVSEIFEFWGAYIQQPDLDIENSNWIISITKYKDGKIFSVLNDIDTKKYLKNHF